MEEEWKAVVGYEGYYEVSNQGQVRSLDRQIVNSRGAIYNIPGVTLKLGISNQQGHLRVCLSKGGQVKYGLVHRLVAEAFIPNPSNYPLVRHWDDNPVNNQVSNLLWGDHSLNALDSVRLGTNSNAGKTHCPRNHPYDGENTFNNSAKRISRTCKICKRKRDREYHARKMQEPEYREAWNERSRQRRERLRKVA